MQCVAVACASEGHAALRAGREFVDTFLGLIAQSDLFHGSIFQTGSAAGGVSGIVSIIYVIPAIFVGPLMQQFQGNIVVQLVKIPPTYYIADGTYNALANSTVFTNALLDTIVILGCTAILLTFSVWTLRRQTAVVATI